MIRFVMLLWLSLCAITAIAEPLMDAYRAEVQVVNQSEAERISAAKATMGDVIVRIAGDAAALQHPLVTDAINNAPNYLLRFNYVSRNDATNTAAVTLVLNYSPQAIEKLLREANLWHQSSQQEITIQIANVQSFSDFKQVQTYLRSISFIRRSELMSTHKDMLVFNLSLVGDAAMLKNTLINGGKLQVEEFIAADIQAPSLRFRWQ